MPNVKNNAAAQETQRRLLEAAGQVFAERGLHSTTIKQITDRAGVSIAAVNYHFRDKLELYASLMRQIIETDAPRLLPPLLTEGSAQQRLRDFIHQLVARMLEPDAQPWKHVLLWRELIQPTPSFECIVDGYVRPLAMQLNPLIRAILGPNTPQMRIQLTINSIFAQCLYYSHDAEIVRRMNPELQELEHAQAVERIAEHIANFTLRALRPSSLLAKRMDGKAKERELALAVN